jgi:hypothetical protein
MMAEQPKAKGGQPYQYKSTGFHKNPVEQPTLAQAGIDKNLATPVERERIIVQRTSRA